MFETSTYRCRISASCCRLVLVVSAWILQRPTLSSSLTVIGIHRMICKLRLELTGSDRRIRSVWCNIVYLYWSYTLFNFKKNLHCEAEKGTTFTLCTTFLICNIICQNLVFLFINELPSMLLDWFFSCILMYTLHLAKSLMSRITSLIMMYKVLPMHCGCQRLLICCQIRYHLGISYRQPNCWLWARFSFNDSIACSLWRMVK